MVVSGCLGNKKNRPSTYPGSEKGAYKIRSSHIVKKVYGGMVDLTVCIPKKKKMYMARKVVDWLT